MTPITPRNGEEKVRCKADKHTGRRHRDGERWGWSFLWAFHGYDFLRETDAPPATSMSNFDVLMSHQVIAQVEASIEAC
jgi:hypothetical protein